MLIDLVGKLEEEALELKNEIKALPRTLEAPPRPTGDASVQEEGPRADLGPDTPTAGSEAGDIWEGESTGKDYEIVTYHRKEA